MTVAYETCAESVVELHERESNGIRVTLVWDRGTEQASVLVWDERSRSAFTVHVGSTDKPLDVFHHPFAYLAPGT